MYYIVYMYFSGICEWVLCLYYLEYFQTILRREEGSRVTYKKQRQYLWLKSNRKDESWDTAKMVIKPESV